LQALCVWKKIGCILALGALTAGGALRAQNVESLLGRLASGQVRHDGFYYAGMFPAVRAWAATPGNIKADNSIFFTGLIVLTLKELRPQLTPAERILCDSIISRAVGAYPHFRNRSGRPTFNFWPTDRPVFFPNSVILHHFKDSKQIADDLDDTSILWMGEGIPDSTARKLKALMDAHAGGRARSTYRAVADLPAYSAWFGVKTPPELDAGVLCNVLYFLGSVGLAPDAHDSASARFLGYVLAHRKYWTDPAYASTYYPRTPVLIYHFARLLGRYPTGLEAYIPALKADARRALVSARDPMDRVILATALLRLGDTVSVGLPGDPEKDPFLFYIANISSLFQNPIRRMFLHSPLCIYHFYCPAYNDALLLEYLVLRRVNPVEGRSSTPSP
jgi:hypothetical protein